MRDIRIATVQFEAQDADKDANLARMEELAAQAVARGAEIVSFHECCISGYTFLQDLPREAVTALAEGVPDGPSCRALESMSRSFGVPLMAGLIERDGGELFNTYMVVAPDGFVTKFRKLHAFISPHVSWGSDFCVFDLCGVRCGILICYDNNLVENPRINALMGAEVIFAPHVTCGLPSPMPGRGLIDRELWENRERDPVRLRREFEGPKGREWLMRWLPTRAYENGMYYVFSNAVGVDADTVKTGNAMIIDPFGEILAEAHALGDDVVVALCTADKLALASGQRYLKARRPDLYGKLTEPLPEGQKPVVLPGWRMKGKE
ncbi:nitrilase [bacterium]|nr:nitrilase [bacterium]